MKRAVAWLERKFASFDSSRQSGLPVDENRNDKKYFASARTIGFIRELPETAGGDINRPVLVAAVEMRNDITERTSRQTQFNFAKRVLQNAVKSGAAGLNGYPNQGIFFFYDKDGYFRISLVSAAMEGRRFKFNEAKRQSFYVNPERPNNVAKSRLQEPIRTFADLKEAFSVEALTKEFYGRLFEWYEWAMKPRTGVTFPNDVADDKDDRKYNNEAIIRLITRLMFTWFIRQRGLVPEELFKVEGVSALLKGFKAESMEDDNYYRCILQNLFFATLNCQPEKRRFRVKTGNGMCKRDWTIKTLYRYEKEFSDSQEFKRLMSNVPFLNCALFDCLDKQEREQDGGRTLLFDGFSDTKKNRARVPNGLFFHKEKGIVRLFDTYEFTIDENNADDADVALDPELLGKVFENLLGAFNPETQETARKATGSFYTPREIVDYMVEESLKSHLKTKVPQLKDEWLDDLFDKTKAADRAELPFDEDVAKEVREALYTCKVLDPACGSGAFPMGVLHCMVRLFGRLDPNNYDLSRRLVDRYKEEIKKPSDPYETEAEKEERLAALKVQLKEGEHYPDYARKLYLIENCIYGVDIQPIATQISKLRFFISLLCDQLRSNWNECAENHGLLSLPNLEAKFVCANTLISLPETSGELNLSTSGIPELRQELQENRHKIFAARTYKQKDKLKDNDQKIRDRIRDTVRSTLAKPDKDMIALQMEVIEKLKEDRKLYETPKMVKKVKPVQDSLFGEPSNAVPAYEMVDTNKAKRDEIDDKIQFAQKKIDEENAKSRSENVTAIDKLARMVSGWDPYDQNATSSFFDPQWMFNIENGFDIVIGNPPYISAPDQLKDPKLKKQRETLSHDRRFSCLIQKWDLYIAFMELSLRVLLKDRGAFTMIVPYPLTNQNYGAAIRKMLLTGYALKSIVDLQGVSVFENATVTNCIPFVQKISPLSEVRIIKPDENGRFNRVKVLSVVNFMPDDKTCVWKTSGEKNLLSRFNGMYCLGDYCYISVGMVLNADEKLAKGAFTKEDLISLKKDRRHPRPYVEGKDIDRYIVKRVRFLEYGTERVPSQIRRPTFPELYLHPKLILNTLGTIKGTYDSSGYFTTNHKLNLILPWRSLKDVENNSISVSVKRYCVLSRKDMERLSQGIDELFLLGLLNSRMGQYLLNLIRGGDINIYPEHLRAIPVAGVERQKQLGIILLVEKVLAAKKKDSNSDTSAWESEIDKLVYKLYGLTDDEIAIVEGRDNKEEVSGKKEPVLTSRRAARAVSRVSAASTAADDDEELE